MRAEAFFRFFVELVARYVVVSYLRRVSTEMRNLYWLRTMQAPANSKERKLLTRVGIEASGLMVVFKRRDGRAALVRDRRHPRAALPDALPGLPGLHFDSWWTSTIFALVGALVGVPDRRP